MPSRVGCLRRKSPKLGPRQRLNSQSKDSRFKSRNLRIAKPYPDTKPGSVNAASSWARTITFYLEFQT